MARHIAKNKKGEIFMDFKFITELYVPIAIAGCIVVGFIIKKWMPTDNKWIPTILPVLGVIIACLFFKTVDISTIVGGAVSGMAAVGLHQLVTQHIDAGDIMFVDTSNAKEDDEDEDK